MDTGHIPHSRWLAGCAFLLLLASSVPASAQTLEPLELQLPPWSTEVGVTLDELFGPGTDPESLTAADAPLLGQVSIDGGQLTYQPDPAFFAAGGDAFVLARRPRSLGLPRAVVVTLLEPDTVVGLEDDLESGGLAMWDDTVGSVAVISDARTLEGDASLLLGGPAGVESFVGASVEVHGGGTSNGHVAMVVDVDGPPAGGGLSFAATELVLYTLASSSEATPDLQLRVTRVSTTGDWLVRLELLGPCGGTGICHVGQWLPLPDAKPVRLDLWANDVATTLRLASGQSVELDTLGVGAHLPMPGYHAFGVLDPVAAEDTTVALDDLRIGSWFEGQAPPRLDLVDTFDEETLQPHWSVVPIETEALDSETSTRVWDASVLRIEIDDVAQQDDLRATLVHRPDGPQRFWGASFRVSTRGLSLADGQSIVLLGASSEWWTHGLGYEHLRLWVVAQGGAYHVRAHVRDETDVDHYTPLLPLASGDWHDVLVQWQAGTFSGGLRLWADDQEASLVGVPTSSLDIESVRLGAFGVVPALADQARWLEIDNWASWTGGSP